MKRIAIALLFTLLASVYMFSQNHKIGAELSEIRKNKNHLDLDIKNIFSGLGNATLLYKRSYQSGDLIDVNSIRLLRLSARIDNQITFTDDPTRKPNDTAFVFFHPSDIIDFQIGLGFERQKMNKHFVHYFGVDGILNFFKSDDDFLNAYFSGVANNSTRTTDRFLKVIRTGINPFFGVKYYFTPRISIGIETGISLLYFNQTIREVELEEKLVNGRLEVSFVEGDPVKSNGIQTRFNNLRFLTVGYTF
ncbi:MAG: hypothetical protein D6714_06005 [Bacteroidetes bacterium]|nr:MAG: hypothetical protein D6714_06005 [Bacteroidota bacterium]